MSWFFPSIFNSLYLLFSCPFSYNRWQMGRNCHHRDDWNHFQTVHWPLLTLIWTMKDGTDVMLKTKTANLLLAHYISTLSVSPTITFSHSMFGSLSHTLYKMSSMAWIFSLFKYYNKLAQPCYTLPIIRYALSVLHDSFSFGLVLLT